METEAAASEDLAWRWHDNVIYGLAFDRGEPDEGDWRSDLILDIDFIAAKRNPPAPVAESGTYPRFPRLRG